MLSSWPHIGLISPPNSGPAGLLASELDGVEDGLNRTRFYLSDNIMGLIEGSIHVCHAGVCLPKHVCAFYFLAQPWLASSVRKSL